MLKTLMGAGFDPKNTTHLLRAVQRMFEDLTKFGVFDSVVGHSDWTHPDAINELCDAVASAAAGNDCALYTVQLWGGTEPSVFGPYQSDEERLEATRTIRFAEGNKPQYDSYCRLNIDPAGEPNIESFLEGELDKTPA